MPPRFDIGSASKFQSRDGGLGTGGQIKNGFVEAAPGGVWSWQRPALASGQVAPFTGTALGMLVLGSTLYGIGNDGTANSFTVQVKFGTTPFTLVAVQSTFTSGTATDIPAFGYRGGGSVAPGTWNGASVVELFSHIGKPVPPPGISPESYLTLAGSRAQNFIASLRIEGVTKLTTSASYSVAGGNTTWLWTGSPVLVGSAGTFTGGYK